MRALLLALGLALAAPACSGGNGGGTNDAGSDTAPPLELTCQQIRSCTWTSGCETDACVDDCAQRGSTNARAAFQALLTCTKNATCQPNDFTCICEQQCFQDGVCLAETEACVGDLPADLVCEQFCH